MAGMDWFRWHHGSVTDPKFQLIARKSGSSIAEVIGIWATLLESASMNDVRGCHGTLDFEAIDCSLGLKEGQTEKIHGLMVSRGIIDFETKMISSWLKRQPVRERDSDKSTDRVKAFRQKQRQETPLEAHETPCNATKHLEEIRGDKSNTPIPPVGASQPIVSVKRQSAVSITTWLESIKAIGEKPIPADDSVFEYADKVGIPPEFLRLYWKEFKERYSQKGSKRYTDWRKVFRNSVRGNWLQLWRVGADGSYFLTTQGKQAEMAAA